jgi:outer membrane protein OmpA-like peptidoglycan-associated protein
MLHQSTVSIAAFIAPFILAGSAPLSAQVPNPTQQPVNSAPGDAVPIFRIEVVARTTQAVNYLHRGGETKIDFQGTALMPSAKGSAKVESIRGVTHVNAELKGFAPPSSFGPEYLTYVLWAISPDGRAVNLGELTLSDYGNGSTTKLSATSDIQTFGMIVTAEPYYGVTLPSDVVVMENVVRPDTRGVVESITAKYELLPRGTYTAQGTAAGFAAIHVGKKDPFELYEAENALQLARVAGAERYAADSYSKAADALGQAERYQIQKAGQKPVITMAREAVVRAEDARVIAIRAEQKEFADNDRAAALARENAASARADAETQQRADADAARTAAERSRAEALTAAQVSEHARLVAEQAKRDAEEAKAQAEQTTAQAVQARAQAEQARAQAEQAKADADQARQSAVAQQQQLASEADRARQAAADSDVLRLKAEQDRERAEQDRVHLREQLLHQFNQVLQTTETARGLIVNMSDVLFDTARYTLKPGAREKLAKVAGIILGHPGLRIEVEGFTDSVGGDEYNLKLSDNRANSVREYLVAEGIQSDATTAKGFGKSNPVADNSNAAGRQMNRRVQLVVSGEILGTQVTSTRTTGSSANYHPHR